MSFDGRNDGAFGLVVLVCPLGRAGAGSAYNAASVPASLACLLVAVQWRRRRDTDAIPLAFIAGLVAGVAFGVKQNVGLLTMTAFSATVIPAPAASSAGMRRRVLPVAWVAFAGVGAILASTMLAKGASGPVL